MQIYISTRLCAMIMVELSLIAQRHIIACLKR